MSHESVTQKHQFELYMAAGAIKNLGEIQFTHAASPMDGITEGNVEGIAMAVQSLGHYMEMLREDQDREADAILKQVS